MIRHVSHVFDDLEGLDAAWTEPGLADAARAAQSVLVQVYSATHDPGLVEAVAACIFRHLPDAIVVGATTVGEIAHGQLHTGRVVVGITCFDRSMLTPMALACPAGAETRVGAALGRRIGERPGRVAGVLLLATPLSMDAAALLGAMEEQVRGIPVFGGGAGDYAAMATSSVFCGSDVFTSGAVAVVLEGDDLHCEVRTYLGWRPLSRPMRITEVDGLRVRRVDGGPAFGLYERYLGLRRDDDFFLNALEFPFLIERDGNLLARVPVAVTDDQALQFVADIREGETVRIGYGDPELIVDNAAQVHQALARFGAQVTLLFSCGCRRFLMQQDVDLETLPFEAVAPTFGFYTYGEFYGTGRLDLLNSTMVAVGLREGPPPGTSPAADPGTEASQAPASSDPYAHKHARIVARLMHFIEAVTSELEDSHREVARLSMTDKLTQLPNRARLDQILDDNIAMAARYGTAFSIILLDVDHFKQVNDTHGHLMGDEVLRQVGRTLAANTRTTDTVGRWGGEEFLVIAPLTPLAQAARLAEKLRACVAATDLPAVGRKTISLGVATCLRSESLNELVGRADAALYRAKQAGRDRVVLAPPVPE